jgi:16S rRNA processing protein RimM
LKDAATPPALEIGRVAKPHGILGAVKVALHWSGSDTLSHVESVELELPDGSRRTCAVESVRASGKLVLLKLEGVASRNDAEALRGAKILVPRSALPPLAEGEYYLVDLMGARVVSPEGVLGEVVDVQVHPTVDAVVVEGEGGKRHEVPLAPPWLVRVDSASKLIELASLDGLLE